jgi:hypothetical protein
MTNPPDATKPSTPDDASPAPSTSPSAEPVELQSELHRVLFDHEMERGTTITKIRQPRRRGRIIRA